MRRGDGVYDVVEAMQASKKNTNAFSALQFATSANYSLTTPNGSTWRLIRVICMVFSLYANRLQCDTSLLLTPEQREYVYRASDTSATKITASRFSRLIFKMTANLSADV